MDADPTEPRGTTGLHEDLLDGHDQRQLSPESMRDSNEREMDTVEHLSESLLKVPNKRSTEGVAHRGPTSIAAVDKDTAVIFQSSDFVVIDKPVDVRMDGDFDVTVEKLLLSWKLPGVESSANIKWVHQLDFATSGVLCVALHRKAAAAASLAFSLRQTKKRYLALIVGHLDFSSWPQEDVSLIGGSNVYHLDSATKLPKVTSKHAVGGQSTWQDHAREENLAVYLSALGTELERGGEESSKMEELRELASITAQEFMLDSKLRKRLRKVLKARGVLQEVVSDSRSFQEPPKREIAIAKVAPREPIEVYSSVVRCRAAASDNIENGCKEAEFLRISIPVAEIEGDFRCERGHGLNPGKDAQTDLHIVMRGFLRGRPVTKVFLSPLTGRRHQLRIHCLSLGHPIVGDFTYGGTAEADQERMMLHAFSLHVPAPTSGKQAKTFSSSDPLINVQARDPFALDKVDNS